MAPEYGLWREALPRHLLSEREAFQSKVTADKRRTAALKRELAALEGSISVNQRQVRILGSQIAFARALPVIAHPLEVPGTEASLRDFISRQSDSALEENDDLKVHQYLESQAQIILAGRRLVRVGFDPDRRIFVPEPKVMILNVQERTVQIGDDEQMGISALTAVCLKPFYYHPEDEYSVQSIVELAGGKSGPNALERWEAKLGIPVFKKVRRENARTFWSLDLDWIKPLPYIEKVQRREKIMFAVLDAVVSQVSSQSVPAYLDLHRALGPSGKVDIYSERIHRISDDSQTRMLDFYTSDELTALFTPALKELFEQSKEDSKRALWDDGKVQIWNGIESLMRRFKISKYDAFLKKLCKVIKDSEHEYIRVNPIKGSIRSAIV